MPVASQHRTPASFVPFPSHFLSPLVAVAQNHPLLNKNDPSTLPLGFEGRGPSPNHLLNPPHSSNTHLPRYRRFQFLQRPNRPLSDILVLCSSRGNELTRNIASSSNNDNEDVSWFKTLTKQVDYQMSEAANRAILRFYLRTLPLSQQSVFSKYTTHYLTSIGNLNGNDMVVQVHTASLATGT